MTDSSDYIVGPAYDWIFFIAAPTTSLVLGIAVADTTFVDSVFAVDGEPTTWAEIVIGSIIHAHLVAVFLRSHANPTVFRRYRIRFAVVPLVVGALMLVSTWASITALVVATWWDVYHSGAQTFGFGRIYDRNQGNPASAGRRLDFAFNQLIYAGPILGGATLIDHLEVFENYEEVGAILLASVPAQGRQWQPLLTWVLVIGACGFALYYVWAHFRMLQRGYRVSPQKIVLYVSTAACTIYAWGFNSFGEAFFAMNLFHAVQYLALVWASERKSLLSLAGIAHKPWGSWALGACALAAVMAYGVAAQLAQPDSALWWTTTMVVSLMHFWYDGFIWSVTKNEI